MRSKSNISFRFCFLKCFFLEIKLGIIEFYICLKRFCGFVEVDIKWKILVILKCVGVRYCCILWNNLSIGCFKVLKV